MAHRVFYQATRVHRIVSTVIEINVRHTGGPAQRYTKV